MKKEKYYIGLDIGTNSVGYSVTNQKNKVIRYKNKIMQGSRLFEEGNTAKDRRLKRSGRRRNDRKKNRVKFLRELLKEEIEKVDQNFLKRLDDSFLQNVNKYILFNENNYTDIDFHKEFPTIYHLRYDLMTKDEKKDIRLIYLALEHIIKNRGNFLMEGSIEDIGNDIDEKIENLDEVMSNLFIEYFLDREKLKNILLNKETTGKDKEKEIKKIFKSNDKEIDKKIKQMIKAIIGYTFNLKTLFDLEVTNKSFRDELDEIEAEISDDFIPLFEALKNVYNNYSLSQILGNASYISEAMIEKYKQHKKDLKDLKKYIRNNCSRDTYKKMFKEKGKGYSCYIDNPAKMTQEEINKEFEKLLKNPKNENGEELLKRAENRTLIPKQRSVDNIVIPNQYHLVELIKIIDKQEKYYNVIKENKEKIKKILTFRIPYYVGPLVTDSEFSWVSRTEEKIYPWNLFNVVNQEETARKFIERMRNKCTYLIEEDVIPKKSLLYSKYEVLNEINKVRINDKKISKDAKMKIIEKIFLQKKKVTHKHIKDFYRNEYNINVKSIKGTQKEDCFASSLSSYIDFMNILGKKAYESKKEMIEKIIYWLTIYNDENIIKKLIKKEYSAYINKEQLKAILKKKNQYTGWSRLSKKLLDGIQDERNQTIIDILEETNQNFMQIINKNEGIKKEIQKNTHNKKISAIKYEHVDELPTSPANKRGIWQAMCIVEEIAEIMGYEPDSIFVEMPRSNDAKKRTVSRQKRLKKIYDNIKDLENKIKEEFNDKEENDFKSNRMYLYFIQKGKCLYSKETLDIDNLSDYHIDHIIPQSYIKDDSLSNKVLVKSIYNMKKTDGAIKDDIKNKMRSYWNDLHKNGLMTNKKYYNLINPSFSEDKINSFINRQLVETRQISKHVCGLLYSRFRDTTKIVPVKARMISHFREANKLYKIRGMNDFHHSHDAYFTILIGRHAQLRFKELGFSSFEIGSKIIKDIKKYSKSTTKKSYLIEKMRQKIIDKETGEIIWNGKETMKYARKILMFKNINVSRKKEENTSSFFNETIYPAGSSNAKIEIKKGLDTKLYGGRTRLELAYSCIFEAKNKKGKREKYLVSVPVIEVSKIKAGKKTLKDYLTEEGYMDIKIIREKIDKWQEFELEDCLFHIISENEICNARQLVLSYKYQEILKDLEYANSKEDVSEEKIMELYDEIVRKIETLYLFKRTQSVLEKLKNYRETFKEISYENKKSTIFELLNITGANSNRANIGKYCKIQRIKGYSELGRMKISKFPIENMCFIDKSVTGLYETRTKL